MMRGEVGRSGFASEIEVALGVEGKAVARFGGGAAVIIIQAQRALRGRQAAG